MRLVLEPSTSALLTVLKDGSLIYVFFHYYSNGFTFHVVLKNGQPYYSLVEETRQ